MVNLRLAIASKGIMAKSIAQVATNLGIKYKFISKNSTKHDLEDCAIMLEFTSASCCKYYGDLCLEANIPYISGTTGLSSDEYKHFNLLAQKIPVFWSANMSIGIAYMHRCLSIAQKLLANKFDCHISEIHHKDKADAISGTAMQLSAQLRSSGWDVEKITSTREGDTGGVHTVAFTGLDEDITISHRALDRAVFARGSIDIAAWLLKQQLGYYVMDDYIHDCISSSKVLEHML